MDPTRMKNEDLEPKEVKSRVRDLFNLKDANFKKLTIIDPALKLCIITAILICYLY
jgi:hypothetical protein